MARILQLSRTTAWIDAAIGAGLTLLVVLSVRESKLAAAEAVRLTGHNIDSGFYTLLIAVVYFAPVSILFGVASVAIFKGWRAGKVLHWLAIAGVVLPLLWAIGSLFI